MTDLITKTVQEFFAKREEVEKAANIEVVSFIVGLIRENIERILELVTDDIGENPLRDITNAQFVEIVDIIYEINYEAIAKNASDLFEKIKKVFPSKRLSPEFANGIPSTDLKTSTENLGEKEALPSDK